MGVVAKALPVKMASMLTIPAELLTRIFEACDNFPQVIALASVCKHTYAVLESNLRCVAKTQIRSFDDALMAVRATAIVLKAYQAGTLPPLVAIESLSPESKLPNLTELKEVLNMQYLVQCIEWMYFNSKEDHYGEDTEHNLFEFMKYGTYPSKRRRFPDCLIEDIPGTKNATIDSFRDNFYRAMYRLLLAGAVLARAYMAPLFRARQEWNKKVFAYFGHHDYMEIYNEKNDPHFIGLEIKTPPTEEDLAWIRQFPVYNYDVLDWTEIGMWRNQEYETCFGPFASWIVEDGRKRQQSMPHDPDDDRPDWAENAGDIGGVRELMLLMVAYDHFNSKFEDSSSGVVPDEPNHFSRKRTVTIVRFGTFQIEEVAMPAAFEDLKYGHLFANNHSALEGSQGEGICWFLK